MSFQLAPTAMNAGYRIEPHDTVGSTNALALEHARNGDAGNLWIVSRQQDGGRGRRGRAWQTPQGNLAATLLVVLDRQLQHAATLGFVAGLALAEALEATCPAQAGAASCPSGRGGRFQLKWPNDVLADGAKLAGILLESSLMPGGRMAVVIGIGVNVVAHPDDTPYPATSLAALGDKADTETLFLALSDAWLTNARIWDGGLGVDLIRQRWLTRAAGLGGDVAVRVDGVVTHGIFETIDEQCRFVIREAGGRTIRISAGDVHFGAVASAAAR